MVNTLVISRQANTWCDLGESVGVRTLKSSLGEVHFAENPTWIGPVVPKL